MLGFGWFQLKLPSNFCVRLGRYCQVPTANAINLSHRRKLQSLVHCPFSPSELIFPLHFFYINCVNCYIIQLIY